MMSALSLVKRCALPAIAASTLFSSLSAQEYEVIIIEPWNQTYSLATSSVAGINDRNVVSGCATTEPLGELCSFLWTREDDKVSFDFAGVINNAGVIAGSGAVRWPDGTIELYPQTFSSAHDINEHHVVAGVWGSSGCLSDGTGAIWDEQNGARLIDRDPFNVTAADEVFAINDSNQVVGVRSSTGECGDYEAFYLDVDSGLWIDLHEELLGGVMGITEALDINNHGQVVGYGPADGTVKPFLWIQAGGFEFLPTIPGASLMDTRFKAINDHGVAVGAALTGSGWRAVIWDAENGTRDLNDLADVPADFVIDNAFAINENGWIIGSGHTGVWSPERAVVLIPQEPWSDLGNALTGLNGEPTLAGAGDLAGGDAVTLSLSDAAPSTLAGLVIGGETWYAPFKSGVMVPELTFLILLAVDANGSLELNGTWPEVAAGIPVYFQYWILDSSTSTGFSASNALRATTQ